MKALLVLSLLLLTCCAQTARGIVVRDEQVTRCDGYGREANACWSGLVWVGHEVETCDLRLPLAGAPRWENCRVTRTDRWGFTTTQYEDGEIR
jgi:hypothetical protein